LQGKYCKSRITSQELQVSRIASQELQVKNCKSRIASQELQVKNCKTRIATQGQELQVKIQEWLVKNSKNIVLTVWTD
jgi:hypothetical protein